jgi:hypothetical protein
LRGNPPPASGAQPLPDDSRPSWFDWSPVTEIEPAEEDDVHDVPDVQKEQDDHYYDIDLMKQNFDYENEFNDEVKPKKLCGLSSPCLDSVSHLFSDLPSFWDASGWQHLPPVPRSFEWSPERDHGHRFSWGVRS